MQTATPFPPVSATTAEADRIFAALDQRLIGQGPDRWLGFVTAITSDNRDWWIQVTSHDQATRVVLRASRCATIAQMLTALEHYEAAGTESPAVLEVMRVHRPLSKTPRPAPEALAS